MGKVEDRVEELLERGAVIQLLFPDDPMLSFTLAGVIWGEDRGGRYMRWSAIFPEHQGHVHGLYFDKAELSPSGRDVLFYKEGKLIGSVVPYEEGPIPIDEVEEALVEWKALMDYPGKAEEFAYFLRTA